MSPIESYARFVPRHPYLVLLAVLVVTLASIHLAGTIKTVKTDIRDFLPDDLPVIVTLDTIQDQFGSTDTVYFVLELDPAYQGSNEVRDMRDPRVLRYADVLANLARHTEDVLEVTSATDVLKKLNGGRIPGSTRRVMEIQREGLEMYLSRDYSMSLVRIRLTDDADLAVVEEELGKIIQNIPPPPGVKVSLGGQVLEGEIVRKSISKDMAKTSSYSLVGILVVILLIFRSPRYGLIPLTTILFGTLWAMGYVGLIGMGLTSQTSGVLSMIMGIGIDFGIQVITRYRLELPGSNPVDAMTLTLSRVIVPMSTTTLAALIGFGAMSLGKLTFLGDMGTMMSYGVAASMVAAITAVPALVIITEQKKHTLKKIVGDWRWTEN